ncbi:MAG: hypothetical protein Q4A75_01495 [Peptostreptococcaceae bacterium]|nr:hypothetical protein [Peptostreptococcaceae bacterium]
MIKGKTRSGFEYRISKKRLENYELIEVLGQVDRNPLLIPDVVKLIFDEEQAKRLKDHLRDEEGLVSTEKITNEIMEVFQNHKETKN